MIENNYGHIKINLSEQIKEKGISKIKICQLCQLQHTQLNNYCKNNVVRIDLNVLSRLCKVLQCNIEDILIYEDTPE